ncbi:hypothetical protein GBA52_015390 [Prunus armeniaca]|nr:hypothetical protein GBA52_015390 [Prunus armeniaca]
MRGLSGTPPKQKSLERKKGFGDLREEVGFREKVPLVPVVGKAAEIERADPVFHGSFLVPLESERMLYSLTPVTRKLGTMVQWARMLGYQVLKLGIEPSLPPAATFASISTSGSRSRTQTDA